MSRVHRSATRAVDWFEHVDIRIPGLRFLARSANHRAVGTEAYAGLDAHSHDAWEITWLRAGTLDWWADGRVHEIGPGWCFITPPRTAHGSVTGLLEPSEFYWLQLDPAGISGLDRGQQTALIAALGRIRPLHHGGDLVRLWQDLITALDRARQPSPPILADLAAQACLHRLLAGIIDGAGAAAADPALARALRRAAEGPANIAALARAAGCSASVLHRLFRNGLGDSPAAWLKRQRLSQAKIRLRDGDDDITAIAHAIGFASSQQFSTRFRQLVGLTPSRYRQLARQAVGRPDPG